MPKRVVISVVAFALLATLPSAVSATTITQILGSPSAYDGRPVDVSGTVEHLKQKTSRKGNPYVTFSLCSSQCIHVFGLGSPSIRDRQTITAHGAYDAVKLVGGDIFYNKIEVKDGSLIELRLKAEEFFLRLSGAISEIWGQLEWFLQLVLAFAIICLAVARPWYRKASGRTRALRTFAAACIALALATLFAVSVYFRHTSLKSWGEAYADSDMWTIKLGVYAGLIAANFAGAVLIAAEIFGKKLTSAATLGTLLVLMPASLFLLGTAETWIHADRPMYLEFANLQDPIIAVTESQGRCLDAIALSTTAPQTDSIFGSPKLNDIRITSLVVDRPFTVLVSERFCVPTRSRIVLPSGVLYPELVATGFKVDAVNIAPISTELLAKPVELQDPVFWGAARRKSEQTLWEWILTPTISNGAEANLSVIWTANIGNVGGLARARILFSDNMSGAGRTLQREDIDMTVFSSEFPSAEGRTSSQSLGTIVAGMSVYVAFLSGAIGLITGAIGLIAKTTKAKIGADEG